MSSHAITNTNNTSHPHVEEVKYLIKKMCNNIGLGIYGIPQIIIKYLYFKDKYIKLSYYQKHEIWWEPIWVGSRKAGDDRFRRQCLIWGRYANQRDISLYENIPIKQFNPQILKEYSYKELKQSLKINKVKGRSKLTNKKKMITGLLKI